MVLSCLGCCEERRLSGVSAGPEKMIGVTPCGEFICNTQDIELPNRGLRTKG